MKDAEHVLLNIIKIIISLKYKNLPIYWNYGTVNKQRKDFIYGKNDMKDDLIYIIHIKERIEKIEQYTISGKEAFFQSYILFSAVVCPVIIQNQHRYDRSSCLTFWGCQYIRNTGNTFAPVGVASKYPRW